MTLNIHSDASCFGTPKEKSHTAGLVFHLWQPQDKQPINLTRPKHVLTSLLQFLNASAGEEELGTFFVNAKEEKSSVSL